MSEQAKFTSLLEQGADQDGDAAREENCTNSKQAIPELEEKHADHPLVLTSSSPHEEPQLHMAPGFPAATETADNDRVPEQQCDSTCNTSVTTSAFNVTDTTDRDADFVSTGPPVQDSDPNYADSLVTRWTVCKASATPTVTTATDESNSTTAATDLQNSNCDPESADDNPKTTADNLSRDLNLGNSLKSTNSMIGDSERNVVSDHSGNDIPLPFRGTYTSHSSELSNAASVLNWEPIAWSNNDVPERKTMLNPHETDIADVVSGLLDLSQTDAPIPFESQPMVTEIDKSFKEQVSSDNKPSNAIETHPLLSPCHCSKLKCAEKISEECRKEIHRRFWRLESSDAQQQWLLNHLGPKEDPELTLSKPEKEHRNWYLPDSKGNMIKVCQVFFLRTLGYSYDDVIQQIIAKIWTEPGTKNVQETLQDSVKKLIFMHIKSFLKRYHPVRRRSDKLLKHSFQYGLVRRCYVEFKAVHPGVRVTYFVFRTMFHQISASDASTATLLSGSRAKGHADSYENRARGPGNKKVIMHMDIENDAVIITKNVSDSDTETESERAKSFQASSSNSFNHNGKISSDNQHKLEGEENRVGPIRDKHPLLAPCQCKRNYCISKIPESRREVIHESFWSLEDNRAKREWLLKHIHRSSPQRFSSGRKKEVKSYYLMDESDVLVPVCAAFFQRTLGFSENEKLDDLYELKLVGETRVGSERKRKEPSHRMKPHVRLTVEQHINNYFNTTGYKREMDNGCEQKAAMKRMSLKQLHADFKETQPELEVSYQQYRIIFHDVRTTFLNRLSEDDLDGTATTSNHVSEDMKLSLDMDEGQAVTATDCHGDQTGAPRRRRSTRRTRMRGSMAEDSLLELGGESRMVSSIVSWHESSKASRSRGISRDDIINESKQLSGHRLPLKTGITVGNRLPGGRRKGNKFGYKRKTVGSKQTAKKMNRKGMRPGPADDENVEERGSHLKRSRKRFRLRALEKKHRHPMLPPCQCSRRKCIERIPEERRKEIHTAFWNMENYKERKRWLARYMERREQTVKPLTLFPQKKNESKKYFLPDREDNAVEVCRLFFIHTLGFKWHSVVDVIAKAKKSNTASATMGCVHKRPRRELPDYIINSVKQYIEGLRSSAHQNGSSEAMSGTTKAETVVVTTERPHIQSFDPSKLNEKDLLETAKKTKEVSEISSKSVSQVQEDTATAFQPSDLSKLKAKDLFKDYKIKYKSLKFNLGYQSFRRIFQSVVNPMQDKDTSGRAMDSDHSARESDDLEGDTDYGDAGTQDVKYLSPVSKRSKKRKVKKSNKNESKMKTAKSKRNTPKTFRVKTNKVKTERVSSDDADEDMYFPSIEDMAAADGQYDPQDEDDERKEDGDECILDVGSGYLKRTPSDMVFEEAKYPYIFESKYKKRRTVSMRNNRVNYPVLPPCKCSKRKCAEKFTEAQREKVNDMFWSLGSYNERKQWILEHIKRENIKRRVVTGKSNPRKLESRWYFMPDDDGNKIDVCKDFFLRTLGYKWDSVIDTIGKTTPKGERWAAPDMRGRKPPPHKISEEAVNSMTLYIESVCHTYQPLYQKKFQGQKKKQKSNIGNLVTYGLTMKQLFEDYKSKHPNHKFGYESFRKIFHKVHTSIMSSLPPLPEPAEEPEELCSDDGNSAEHEFSEATEVHPAGDFQNSQFVPSTVPFSHVNHYTSPPPLPVHSHSQPAHSHHPTASHHQQPTNAVAERRSCVYQYGNQPVDSQQPLHLPPSTATDSGTSAQERYNSVDHDQFMKYSHNLYGPPPPVISGSPGHFPQMADPLGYNTGHNPRSDMVDSPGTGGQNQFPPYFMPNPEPLRRQVYQMASQYQSILHHIAESSRFLNYSGFPPAEGTFQAGQDKSYPYPNRQDFYRENPYNIPKSAHGYAADSSSIANQYPSHSHLPQSSMAQETPTMVISPYSDENDHHYMQDQEEAACMLKDQDMMGGFGNSSLHMGKGKKSCKKRRPPSKKNKNDQPKVKRERKIRPKSSRNYGDYYPVLPPCHCKKRKCTEKFTEFSRQQIHDTYWDLKNYNERKQWMLLHIKREDCKRRRVDQHESSRKQESRWYYLPDEEGNLQEVCKDFFLRTLGYKWDSVIDTIRRTTPKGEISSRPDQRGKKPPAHKLSNMVLRSVVQYVESMQQASHPSNPESAQANQANIQASKQANTSQDSAAESSTPAPAVSIPYGLTMKDLHDDYKAKHAGHKIGYESFRRIFKSLANSEKIVMDDKSAEEDALNPESENLAQY